MQVRTYVRVVQAAGVVALYTTVICLHAGIACAVARYSSSHCTFGVSFRQAKDKQLAQAAERRKSGIDACLPASLSACPHTWLLAWWHVCRTDRHTGLH